ncbi:NAD(P)/FAD-dependent oxidoreductase [Mucilaginibacter aquaedulcis]|uniref:NAD(P)/FAD-dependent oxidoreductase n=1 Tax=Mucilaginibacter aquaedulcis TaxID=1187081 RepID=UPI0025B4C637|nr:NAD(P)/FAD-dependent oxidoreductase [Mucilaginibacter aquaedulcis]MDN3551539.1 NAD(P)/FAD-dependent oxidoreductase [Mucilaginibacter aquaedulcis]
MEYSAANKKHIIVIGGGFAGLNFVSRMLKNKYYQITLVDKNNYNYFTPLLYQVATSFLEPASISYPFRKVLKNKGASFRMASLKKVDTAANEVHLSDGGILHYDILVFAAGSKTNFFGNESVRSKAFSLKGIDDALYMRNELIKTMEKAAIETDPAVRQKLLTVVIAGGGPTGVEVAGMLAEMKRYILGNDYPQLLEATTEIHIVDGSPYLLAPMSDKSHQTAYKALADLGVHIKLNTHVNSYENGVVQLSDGSTIEAETLIWAAGVIANTFEGIAEESIGKGKRMLVDAFNRVNGYENIYAIGDISLQFSDPDYPNGHPQLAQPAIQHGKALAKNLNLVAKGQQLKPFIYFDRGDMAIIGRRVAMADLFKHKLHLGGFLGLMSWLFIHLVSLANYNNKIKTFYNWAIAYLTHDQALRMIFRSENRENRMGE